MKIMFISLGCDKNLVDTEVMMGHLLRDGYTFTDDEYAGLPSDKSHGSTSSPSTLNLSQHQGLFQGVGCLHQMTKY